MSFKKQYDLISKAISSLSPETIPSLGEILEVNSISKLVVYQKNILNLCTQRIATDFPVTKNYLGEKNLQYFSRKYLLEKSISSENIIEFSKHFPQFLANQFSIHQDEKLEYLAQIDFFWTNASNEQKSIEVPVGIGHYWQKIFIRNFDCSQITIDFTKRELIKLLESKNQYFLSIIPADKNMESSFKH